MPPADCRVHRCSVPVDGECGPQSFQKPRCAAPSALFRKTAQGLRLTWISACSRPG